MSGPILHNPKDYASLASCASGEGMEELGATALHLGLARPGTPDAQVQARTKKTLSAGYDNQ